LQYGLLSEQQQHLLGQCMLGLCHKCGKLRYERRERLEPWYGDLLFRDDQKVSMRREDLFFRLGNNGGGLQLIFGNLFDGLLVKYDKHGL
jgi:hypothetical protein